MTNFSAKANAAFQYRLALDSEEGGRFARAQADSQEAVGKGALLPAQVQAFAKRRGSIYDFAKAVCFKLEKSVQDPRYAWGFISDAFESALKKSAKDPFHGVLSERCREDALARLALVGWSKLEAPEWSLALDAAALKWSEGLSPERALRAMSMAPPERFKSYMGARPPTDEQRRLAAVEAARWVRMETASLALGKSGSLLDRIEPQDEKSPSYLSLAFKKGLGAEAARERLTEGGGSHAISILAHQGGAGPYGLTWSKEARAAFGKSVLSVDFAGVNSLKTEGLSELVKAGLAALSPEDFALLLREASSVASGAGASIELDWEDAVLALVSEPRMQSDSQAVESLAIAAPYIKRGAMTIALGLMGRVSGQRSKSAAREMAVAEALIRLAYEKGPSHLLWDSGLPERHATLNANALEMAVSALMAPNYYGSRHHIRQQVAGEGKDSEVEAAAKSIARLCLQAGLSSEGVAPGRGSSLAQKLALPPWLGSGAGEWLAGIELDVALTRAAGEPELLRKGPKAL